MTARDLPATPLARERRTMRVMLSALGWGGGMAGVRMICSFVSIKLTAVMLGPAGLAVIAQFSNFVSLFQSMLGQGLMTGVVRLDAEYGGDAERRRRVRATAARMLLALAMLFGLVMATLAGPVSQWLLSDSKYAVLIALSCFAVAAAMITDLLGGTLSAAKEISLVGASTMLSTVLGLAIFAPCAYVWGVSGGLWASFAVLIVSALVPAIIVGRHSRGVQLADFLGPFDRTECRRLFGFYPMLLVNGALAPLTLILVRDALVAGLGLDAAGLWQATWRLSEAYQAVIVSSTSLYFIPSLGERLLDPPALRHQLLRTLAMATGSTALLALPIGLLREPIVQVVLSERFHPVAQMLPLQLAGDVLKMAGWILAMTLVATMRTRSFIALTILSTLSFAGFTHAFLPVAGIDGVLWAYVATGVLQVAFGAIALRDLLAPRPHAGRIAPNTP
jgi:polysaccharide transporter, PST family